MIRQPNACPDCDSFYKEIRLMMYHPTEDALCTNDAFHKGENMQDIGLNDQPLRSAKSMVGDDPYQKRETTAFPPLTNQTIPVPSLGTATQVYKTFTISHSMTLPEVHELLDDLTFDLQELVNAVFTDMKQSFAVMHLLNNILEAARERVRAKEKQ